MFLDSSVRSTRTISLRPPAASTSVATRVSTSRSAARPRSSAGVHAKRMDADAGDVAPVADLLPGPVDLGAEEGLAAVEEGIGPALAQEAGVVGAEDAGQHLAADARPAASGSSRAAPTACARSARSGCPGALGEHAAGPGTGGSPAPRALRPAVLPGCRWPAARRLRPAPPRTSGYRSGTTPTRARSSARSSAGWACRTACGARTRASSWPRRCRRGGRSPAGCRACARPSRRLPGPGRAARPARTRAAARSSSLSAAQTQSMSASSATADKPDTMPPPPRLADKRPSSPRVNETGPRLDAMSTCPPAALRPCTASLICCCQMPGPTAAVLAAVGGPAGCGSEAAVSSG